MVYRFSLNLPSVRELPASPAGAMCRRAGRQRGLMGVSVATRLRATTT